MPDFRLRSQCVLFTWAQLESDHVSVFSTVDAVLPVGRAVVARELHADGQPHFHAYVEFSHRPDRIITTQFDIGGKHPNVKPKSSKAAQKAAEQYCRKGNDWIEYGFDDTDNQSDDEEQPVSLTEKAKTIECWDDAVDWGFAHKVPFPYIQAAWACRMSVSPPTLAEGDEVLGTIRSDVLRFMQYDPHCTRTLVLEGPTGCGKTTWAKRNMPRPSLFVSHMDDLKHLRPEYHRSLIFDDMTVNGDEEGKGKWPIASQIHLVDFENQRSIHTRYIVSVIPAGIHKCFTCNVGRYPFAHDAAIQRRVYHVLC